MKTVHKPRILLTLLTALMALAAVPVSANPSAPAPQYRVLLCRGTLGGSAAGQWAATQVSYPNPGAAGIVGYVRRRYTNERTGYQVHLTVLCGHSGPISVHPPTACFEGIGYKVVSGPNQTSVSADDDLSYEFNASSFRQSDASVPEIVRVFWGWGTDGQWSAPENPRFAYRGRSFLYKIYVTDRWLDETGETSLPQIESFMKEALPTITAAISQDDSQS